MPDDDENKDGEFGFISSFFISLFVFPGYILLTFIVIGVIFYIENIYYNVNTLSFVFSITPFVVAYILIIQAILSSLKNVKFIRMVSKFLMSISIALSVLPYIVAFCYLIDKLF